ncbi:MAG: LysR substrate-binding domain-containing protein [Mycobacterium sp.]
MEEHPGWMRRLKIRHLEVFMSLVQTGSQSATAALLHVTQPALSKWLRELEQNVGCPLFERGRPLSLTVYGHVVLRYAQRVLGDSLRTANELESLRAGSSGRVRVGVLRTVAAILLPKAIVHCRRHSPRVHITIYEDSLDNLLPKLLRHELDCVVGRLQPEALNADVFREALYDEPVCAVVRTNHPLLTRDHVTWSDVAAYPWIVPLPGTPLRVRVDAEFAAAGLPSPVDPIESVSLLMNEKLLQVTDMVSVVSRQLAIHYAGSGSLAILPLEMRHALGPVGLLWVDASPTSALARFLDSVRAEAQELLAAEGETVSPEPDRLRQRSMGQFD